MMASTAFAPAHSETTRLAESSPRCGRVTTRSTESRSRSSAAVGTTAASSPSSQSNRCGMGRNASRLASDSRNGNAANSR
jgi:hypothetical protein